jgi:hypothetical protein
MKTLLQFLAALSRAAISNEYDSFRSNHNIGNAYLTERVPAFRSDRKADKATAVARRCRKATGLYGEIAGLPAFTFIGGVL